MLTISFYGSQPPLKMPADSDQTVEDLIIAAARVLEIGPVCRHLFGLRCPDGLWLAISKKLSALPENINLLFRLRFKAHSLQRLKSLDPSAFEYLFNQVRADFHANEIPELIKHPEDGLGLVVTDILLYLLNNPTKKVENVDIKSFMPKELNGFANRLNVKKNVVHYFDTWRDKDAAFVHERYLSKVEEKRCSYGTEEYVLLMDEAGKDYNIRLVIDPFHSEYPGLRYTYASQRKGAWIQLCRLDELVFVSTRFQDLTVELSRETGVPCYFKLQTIEQLESFVGCLNGYYRLIRNWNFDLCQELSTPSLLYLRSNKCHGPVGKLFSAKKLKEKGGGEVGVGLLRESTTEHEKYKLDIIVEANKPPITVTIDREGGKVHLEGRKEELHDSLKNLLRDLIMKDKLGVKLSRILPPSDYDYAELLLVCASKDKQVQNNSQSGPRIISMDHLTATRQNIKRGQFSSLIRAQWDGLEDTNVAVKIPILQNESEKESFLAVINKFAFVNCECIVHIFGVTLNPLSLVMEFFPLGDLSSYLQQNKSIEEVELVEAATHLARALWYLNQEGVQHNNIRCHNILVAEHTDQTFKVKLGDPGMVRCTEKDIHWIPREHHAHPAMAVNDVTTDIWAFSTTLWQIFSMGKEPLPGADLEEVRKLYEMGRLLPRPDLCPLDLYKVMERCWSRDPQARRQPQAIMRDVNQILYQVFNSRKKHSYQTIYRASSSTTENDIEEDTNNDVDDYNSSITTQVTTFTLSDGTTTEFVMNKVSEAFVDDLISIGSDFYPLPNDDTPSRSLTLLSKLQKAPKMALATSLRLLRRVAVPALQPSRGLHVRGKATMVSAAMRADLASPPAIRSALPAQHLTAKVMFDDHTYADFKYIWLRDNCQCPKCIDASTKQKLVDTPNLDVNLKPLSLTINGEGMLQISWAEADGSEHISVYDPAWLFKYGQSFMHNNFASDTVDMDLLPQRPEMELWDRTSIWASFPELSYNEFMETDSGLGMWLDMFYRYGVAVLRGVPTEVNKIVDVVKRFAYVKETQYGTTFDVINKPVEGAHLAYTGVALSHHTDMNYREKSPGMQLLHCLKANDPKLTGEDPGGRSFFADGFRIARWLEENEPAAYHILTSTPVRFSIKNEGKQYSALWPILCTNTDGDVTEVHYNNRTMKPLQAPTHVVTPFYQAYRLFSERLRDPAMGLEFNMVPGDLVAFNNRRVLHGRTAFDASKVDRHLQGCYVDIDEAFAKYDSLRSKFHQN